MAYTSPATVVTGTTITSAWGNSVKSATDFLANPPACRLRRTTNQSIPSSTGSTAVLFDSESYDTDGMHGTSNTDRITFNTAGLYVVQCQFLWASAADYTRNGVLFLVSGSTIIANVLDADPGTLSTNRSNHLAVVYKFSAGQYVTCGVYQTNTAGAARDVVAVNDYTPQFSATWVGLG